MKVEQVQNDVEKGIKGIGNFIKNNPLIVVGVFVVVFLVFLFARPRREEKVEPRQLAQPQPLQPAAPKLVEVPVIKEIPLPFPVEVPAVEKPNRKPNDEKPLEEPTEPLNNVYNWQEGFAAWQEDITARIDAIDDALRDDRPDNVVLRVDPYVLDYYADPERYRREIMRKDVFRPPRPRRNGKILTAEGRWEPIESVIERQKRRFERVLAEGRRQDAELIRRETEIALGHELDWEQERQVVRRAERRRHDRDRRNRARRAADFARQIATRVNQAFARARRV